MNIAINKKFHTLKEIEQQPELWQSVWRLVDDKKTFLAEFLNPFDVFEVVFTGAGSSFFIGEMVAPIFQKDTGLTSRAISTTEIVTHPHHYINPKKSTLLVSFARSGDSPESVAAIELVNQVSENVKHLVITCNAKGALAQMSGANYFSIVLPEEANDKSLAMTSSVTAMALVAQLVGRLSSLEQEKSKIADTAQAIHTFFAKQDDSLQKIASVQYARAVFLGSGAMMGVAREAHLKLQELTDGEIIAKFDSFLGFRHGPKAVVNESTLMVYLFSNDPYVRQYEYDLVNSIKKTHAPILSVGICNFELDKEVENNLDVVYQIETEAPVDEGLSTISTLAVAQLLATYKSIAMGYNPDAPSTSGAIHRVVQGVTIYDYK